MATIITTITRVEDRSVNTRRGAGVIYDVYLSDGTKASTFDRELGMKARALQGQMAQVDITSKQNDRGYTDVYLNGVEPAGAGSVASPPEANPALPAEPVFSGPTEKDKQIARSVALRLAYETSFAANAPGQIVWSDVQRDVDFLLTGNTDESPFAGMASQTDEFDAFPS